MKKAKRFDCVQMKNDVQAGLLRKYRGMTDDERLAAMERELAASHSPVSQLWRDLAAKTPVAKAAEAPGKYTTKPRK